MMESIHYLTAEGLKELEKRLAYLEEERRPQIRERMRMILEEGGGFDDSPEYVETRHEQALLDSEIVRLDTILRHARLIEIPSDSDIIHPGSKVTIVEKGCSQDEVYQLVDPAEANPREGKISIASPLGQALLGFRAGDCVYVTAPDGDLEFLVKAVR